MNDEENANVARSVATSVCVLMILQLAILVCKIDTINEKVRLLF